MLSVKPNFVSRFLIALLLAGLIFTGIATHVFGDSGTPVRVVVLRNSPPLQFYDADRLHASGFAVEVFDRVAADQGLTPTYLLADTWSEMITMILNGRADVAVSLAISDSRLQQLAFSEVIHSSQISMFVRSQNTQITGLRPGLRVGSTEGSIVVDYLRQQPELAIQLYKSIPEGVFALLAGRNDALVAGEWLVLKEAREAGIEDRLKIVGKPLIAIKRAMAVHPENSALLAKLNRGISALIKSPAYRDVYVHWYGKEADFWTVRRVIVIMSTLLTASILILVVWRMRTAHRLNLALRESEGRLRQAMDATSDGLWDWDLTTQRAYFNPNYYRMLGYEPGDFPASYASWEERIHPEDKKKTLAVIQDYVDNKTAHFEIEYRMRTSNGAWKWILGRGEATSRDHYGQALRMIGTHVDITAQKSAEESLKTALQEAENARDRVDVILESVVDALIFTDPEQRIVLMNKAAETLLGQSLSNLAGQRIGSVINEPNLLEYLGDKLSHQSGQRINLQVYHAGRGELRHFQVQSSPVLTRSGLTSGVITLFRDITQEKEIDRMKNEFISIAAHELQTPLSAIIGYSELLLNETAGRPFDEQQRREFLTYIFQKGETLGRLIDDLLNLSRIESGRPLLLDRKPCDLTKMIREQTLHHQRETERHQFVTELPEEPIILNLDRVRIEQVFDNLLSNAVKYSPAGGTIRIMLQYRNREAHVTVSDEGIGMSRAQTDKVFDKFYRANNLDTAVSGLGLGMNIAKNIVEAHDGEIWVESETGRGTQVHVRLPESS